MTSYELKQEAHHLQFRSGKRRPGDSYLECAQCLEETLGKWLTSERVVIYCELKAHGCGTL